VGESQFGRLEKKLITLVYSVAYVIQVVFEAEFYSEVAFSLRAKIIKKMGDWQENSWNNYSQGEWSNAQVNIFQK
jgi:hypothetical protein